MAETTNEQQDAKTEEGAATSPGRLEEALQRMPQAVRQGLVWCAIVAGVALIFSLSSLAAWWPR